jgi:photosystem II stability/assembly factor-like uncharacterized protein
MLKPMRRGRKILPYVVLAVLVAINVSLIAMLFRQSDNLTADPAVQAPVSLPASTSSASNTVPTPTASNSPKPTTTPTPSTKSERLDIVQAKRHMIAISAREAWRATVGDCNTPGQLEKSTDAGRTWTKAAEIDLAPITRLGLEADNVYAVGGAGKSCSARYVAYSADGVVVAQTSSPQNLWFLNPANRDQVYGPSGIKSGPCRRQHVVGLATIDAFQAFLVCTDGTAMFTTNSGKSWRKAGQLPETTAVGSGGGSLWVARQIRSCDGVSIQRLRVRGDELVRGASRCAKGVKIAPGRVALDVSGTAIWLWAGNKVQISTDAGRTWS